MAKMEKTSTEPQTSPFGRRPGGPMAPMMGPAQKPKNFKATVRSLLRYMRPYRASIMVVLVLAILSTAFAIVSPKILGNVTNEIVSGYVNEKFYDQVMSQLPPGVHLPPGTTGATIISKIPPATLQKIPAAQQEAIRKLDLSHRPGINYGAILRLIELLIALYLLSAFFTYVQSWIMSGVSQKISFGF